MTGIVLQARIDSTRLPGKALLPLDGKPLIYRVMEALNQIKEDKKQRTNFLKILACPDDSFSAFKPLADETGFEIFCGSKEDVLERYCAVIRHFSLKRVIRATGDNPFVFSDAAFSIASEAFTLNADYAVYSGIPCGSGVEAVSAGALLCASNKDATPYEREHVCPYLYNHPETFRLHCPISPPCWQGEDLRITVDTQEDYERAVKLFLSLKEEPVHLRYCGETIIKHYREIFNI